MNMEFPSANNTIEKLPYQKWYPVLDLFRKAPDKKHFMDAMKKGGININGENVTPIDFFSTSAELDDDEIEESIEGYLGIDDIENKLEAINKSLIKARDYITEYLHRDLPKEIQNLGEVKSSADAIKLFRKTAAAKGGDGVGLSPAYCALISVAVASFEFNKKETDGLMKESEFLYEKMFQETDEEGVNNFHRLKKDEDGYDVTAVYDDIENNMPKVRSYFRGKNENSLISKFINKPEATAEEAAKDGIGFKFEAHSIEDIKDIIPVITRYFKKNFEAGNLIFENTRLLSAEEVIEIKEKSEKQLRVIDFEGETLLFKEDTNDYSNKNFKSFKINGQLQVPMKGDPAGMIVKRQFEVQIVLTDNDNESGFSNHAIYEAAKKLSVNTRLFGSFTKKYLDIICNEASEESEIRAEEVKEYFKNNFLVELDAEGYSKKRYASEKNTDRFLKSGIFSEDKISKRKIRK